MILMTLIQQHRSTLQWFSFNVLINDMLCQYSRALNKHFIMSLSGHHDNGCGYILVKTETLLNSTSFLKGFAMDFIEHFSSNREKITPKAGPFSRETGRGMTNQHPKRCLSKFLVPIFFYFVNLR